MHKIIGSMPLIYVSSKSVLKLKRELLSRFGEKLFETTTFNKCWDGTYQGEPVPVGTYIYTIEYTHKADEATQYNKFKDGTVQVIK